MNELDLEESIQAKGLTATRLTPTLIDATIVYAESFRVPNTTCTLCALILKNGYVVVGKSAAISMENFDEEGLVSKLLIQTLESRYGLLRAMLSKTAYIRMPYERYN